MLVSYLGATRLDSIQRGKAPGGRCEVSTIEFRPDLSSQEISKTQDETHQDFTQAGQISSGDYYPQGTNGVSNGLRKGQNLRHSPELDKPPWEDSAQKLTLPSLSAFCPCIGADKPQKMSNKRAFGSKSIGSWRGFESKDSFLNGQEQL